uniref:STAS domain-containing protein n=1 Tax=Plectus sambesii TaxID=2011161 RepID=A0A914X8V7_9BILA
MTTDKISPDMPVKGEEAEMEGQPQEKDPFIPQSSRNSHRPSIEADENVVSWTNKRSAMNQEDFDSKYIYQEPHYEHLGRTLRVSARKFCEPCSSGRALLHAVIGFMPILQWLPKYSWKIDLMNDVIGGLTVGVMHVPQGIAYAVLSGVEPVYGLYSSFFPALIYMFFGTSRHVSVGSFAVVSLMAGLAKRRILPEDSDGQQQSSGSAQLGNLTNDTSNADEELTAIAVVSTITLGIGLVQLLMALLRLQFLTSYLSDQVVSGFTTGAAVHVFVTQLDDIFGIKIPKRSGLGYLFLTLYDIVLTIPKANTVSVLVSVCSIAFLYIGKEYVNPLVKKKIPVQIPFELIVLIITTAVSYIFSLKETHDLPIVEIVPVGFPMPSLPKFDLLPRVIGDAVGISVVIVAVHVSMCKMFAKKHDYKIDAGQELYALSFMGIGCSFFSVYPASTGLARSLVNEGAGSKTLLSSLFSCALLLIIILWLGPLLQPLPMCVLASIIVVALKGMFMKLSELKVLWPLSKIDFLIWLVSFVATVGYDVMPGLAISIVFALLTTVFRSQWPRWHMLARLSETSDYRDSERYAATSLSFGVREFRFDAPLLFTNVDRFKAAVHRAASSDPRSDANGGDVKVEVDRHTTDEAQVNSFTKHLVVDCSGFTYVDYMGVHAIKEIYDEMQKQGVQLYFAAAKAPLLDLFRTSGLYESVSKDHFYPTISDAVYFAQSAMKEVPLQRIDKQRLTD